jgi:hypothetical protein
VAAAARSCQASSVALFAAQARTSCRICASATAPSCSPVCARAQPRQVRSTGRVVHTLVHVQAYTGVAPKPAQDTASVTAGAVRRNMCCACHPDKADHNKWQKPLVRNLLLSQSACGKEQPAAAAGKTARSLMGLLRADGLTSLSSSPGSGTFAEATTCAMRSALWTSAVQPRPPAASTSAQQQRPGPSAATMVQVA